MNRTAFWLSVLLGLSLCIAARAGEPVVIAEGSGLAAPRQPQVAVSADGRLHVVYGIGDAVFCTSSTDGGRSFPPAIKAFDCPNMSLGMRRGPRVASAGDALVVAAIGGATGRGRDGDILSWRRSSSGQWTGPVRVNDVVDSAREGLHALASGPDGKLWCCWLDLRSKGTKLYAASSDDGGASWSSNILVYRSPGGSICECCHPSVAVGPDGLPHVLFRNSIDGKRDMYVVSLKADGSASDAMKLGTGDWELKACPMDGGMLAIDAQGQILTAWRRDREVFMTSGGGEHRLGTGQQPWLAATRRGPVVVWVERADGKLFVQTPSSSTPQVLADIARDPVVVASNEGAQAFVAWESVTGNKRAILGQIVE
jgi:hypothetical protein